ncbi:MAG: hypothetical protein QOF95_19 [Pseudonocardiales bacterium]|nr:hypothetical protein [Pseudonocardiales bacterium]
MATGLNILSDANARLLITFPMFLEEGVQAAGEVPLVVVPVPVGQALVGLRPFADLLADLPADGRCGDITLTDADDTAVLIYPSATSTWTCSSRPAAWASAGPRSTDGQATLISCSRLSSGRTVVRRWSTPCAGPDGCAASHGLSLSLPT